MVLGLSGLGWVFIGLVCFWALWGAVFFFGWVSRAVLILRYDKDVGARFIARFSTGLLSNQGEKT